MPDIRRRTPLLALCLLLALSALPQDGFAQASSAPQLDYTVRVADASAHLFHITIKVTNAASPTTDFSLPAWTPGWYTIMPYAANVMRLHAKDAQGDRLSLRAVDKQTWRVETKGSKSITVEYDYLANNLSVNGADLNARRGYFMGTNLFLYVPGHTTDTPSTVRFETPAGWRVATGLTRTNEANVFRARSYDHLVDCPVVMGDYDEETVTVQGKTVHIVIDQKGQYDAGQRWQLREMTARVVESQAKMFGGLPYEDYWVLFVTGPNLRVGGALEHENSTNIMAGREMPKAVKAVMGGVSHEHFHVWNVKRLKPAALIPYDYSRETYFRELWFAEGVTSYYTDVHLRRARVITPEEHLQALADGIESLQENEARRWISAADASVTTWTTYTGGGPFTVNYYNKGLLIGMLLDLEIRAATAGKRGLDDVLRQMFESHFKQGRGYTVEDVERECSQVAGRSFKDFFARYVTGTEELDYNAALAHVGLRLDQQSQGQTYLGVQVDYGEEAKVGSVAVGSPAEAAGVKPGDVLVAVGEIKVAADNGWADEFRKRYTKSGEPFAIKVRRGGEAVELKAVTKVRGKTECRIVEVENATEAQRALRGKWLEIYD
jgi:predicted metalloprotease with PDZ domain